MHMIKMSPARRFVTLRHKDDNFSFSPDGITVVPRAGLEINPQCPREYRQIIAECMRNGWLLPVAHMRDSEYTWELLQK